MRSTHALLRLVLVAGLVLFTALVALNPFFGVGGAAASNHILYVNTNVVGGVQDGSSWENAFSDLQDALDVAQPGEEIWVAAGVYKPTDDASHRVATFQLLNNVAIYGGFAGHESLREERDWEANMTVLSGDIDNNDDTDANGVTLTADDIDGENSFHVVRGSGVDATAVLDGFTITAGQANDGPNPFGGGLTNDGGSPALTNLSFRGNFAVLGGGGMVNFNGGSPTLTNVTFSANSASDGGGMYNAASNPVLTDVTFTGNFASSGNGGGMFNTNSSTPMLTNVSFTANFASSGHGGGMFNDSSSPILTDVTFTANFAVNGGGMYNIADSNPTLTNVTIAGNHADYGGGMYNFDSSSPTLTNVAIAGNFANSDGGGMYNFSHSNPTLTNVTIAGNHANSDGGGMYNFDSSNPTIQNTILWHNQPNAIFNSDSGPSITPTIIHSLVQGCNPNGSWNDDCGMNGGNNLPDADPLFVDAPDPGDAPTTAGNLRLQPNSPAIDKGNNDFVAGVDTDLDGNPRIIGPIVDLGAYELDARLVVTHTIGAGDITLIPDGGVYPLDTVITATATSAAGWSFVQWSGDLSGDAATQTLTVDGNKVITATFSNDPPTAHAGPNQTVTVNSLVMLDGSDSSDEDLNQTLTYGWIQTDGPAVTLSDISAAQPTFTAPAMPTALTFTLVVTDSLGLPSAPDSVTITVNDIPITDLVAASSSPTTLGQAAYFTATIQGGSNVVYTWHFGDGNSGDGAAASHTYAAAGVYTATVEATNAASHLTAITVVTVSNLAPIAHGGPDHTVTVNDAVTLDGSGSFDPDEHLPLTYGWTQTNGPAVTLSDASAAQPTFTAPAVPTVLTFTLLVTDSFGAASQPAIVTVTVIADDPPDATPNITVLIDPASGTFTIQLDKQPDAPVQVQITPLNPARCAVTPPLATFTSETWQTPALFSVNAVAHQPTTVDCEFVVVVTSDDPDYDGLAAPNVTVSVASPQIPGLSLTTGVYLAEPGATCASDAPSTLTVETGSQVVFCFVVGNTGEAMLAIHSLSGNLTGPVFTNLNLSLAPGAGYTHTLTRTVTVNEVHQFEWNAVAAPGSTNGDTAAVAQVGDAVEVNAQTEVTLAIETPTSLPSENQPTVPGFRLLLPGVARD